MTLASPYARFRVNERFSAQGLECITLLVTIGPTFAVPFG